MTDLSEAPNPLFTRDLRNMIENVEDGGLVVILNYIASADLDLSRVPVTWATSPDAIEMARTILATMPFRECGFLSGGATPVEAMAKLPPEPEVTKAFIRLAEDAWTGTDQFGPVVIPRNALPDYVARAGAIIATTDRRPHACFTFYKGDPI